MSDKPQSGSQTSGQTTDGKTVNGTAYGDTVVVHNPNGTSDTYYPVKK